MRDENSYSALFFRRQDGARGKDFAASESTGSVQSSREQRFHIQSSCSGRPLRRPSPPAAACSATCCCCRRWRWPQLNRAVAVALGGQIRLVSPPPSSSVFVLSFRCEIKSSLFACFILGSNLLADSLVCSEQHTAGLDSLT